MSPAGSALRPPSAPAPPPFPLPTALALTALGILAMVGGGTLLATRSGLGIRPQIVSGTLLLAIPALAALALDPARWPAVVGPRPATRRLLALSVLLGAALWVASAGLMEVQSLVAPPPQSYLDAFRAIHRGARAAKPRRRARLDPGDRGAARALRGARRARRVPAVAGSLVERIDRGPGGRHGAAVRGHPFRPLPGRLHVRARPRLRSAAALDRVALALGASPT